MLDATDTRAPAPEEQPSTLRQWATRVRSLAAIVGVAFRADKRGVLLSLTLNLLPAAVLPLSAIALKWLTDAIATRDTQLFINGLVLQAGILTLSTTTTLLAWPVIARVREKVVHEINQELMTLVGDIPGLEHFERPDYADKVELLRAQRRALAALPEQILGNLRSIVQLLASVGVLATAHPALVFLPLFGLPALIEANRSARAQEKLQEERAEMTRTRFHLFHTAMSPAAGKELRVFGLGPTLLERRNELWRELERGTIRLSLRRHVASSLAWGLFAVAYWGAIALVIRDAVRGRATPGDVVLAMTLANQLRAQVQQVYSIAGWATSVAVSADRYWWLRSMTVQAIRAQRPTTPAAVPVTLHDGIRLNGVRFRYPGTDVDVLRDVDVHIPAGSTVAIVGENGAGKSTLVKLLARFYDPTEGTITLEGIDYRNYDVIELRERLAAGYQDFAKFELEARQVVGVGDLPRIDDEDGVRAALGRAASAELEKDLPRGLGTLVGRSFEGGVELSGGQWQKLALGRAMMREDPLLLLLDEPTASLDAQTEHALFERYGAAARQAGARSGAITVLVSHRFSTVRMADLILVIDDNHLREVGTHDELMANGDLYAELYELQAKAYR